jgi:hypothetical protein
MAIQRQKMKDERRKGTKRRKGREKNRYRVHEARPISIEVCLYECYAVFSQTCPTG